MCSLEGSGSRPNSDVDGSSSAIQRRRYGEITLFYIDRRRKQKQNKQTPPSKAPPFTTAGTTQPLPPLLPPFLVVNLQEHRRLPRGRVRSGIQTVGAPLLNFDRSRRVPGLRPARLATAPLEVICGLRAPLSRFIRPFSASGWLRPLSPRIVRKRTIRLEPRRCLPLRSARVVSTTSAVCSAIHPRPGFPAQHSWGSAHPPGIPASRGPLRLRRDLPLLSLMPGPAFAVAFASTSTPALQGFAPRGDRLRSQLVSRLRGLVSLIQLGKLLFQFLLILQNLV